MEFQIMKAEKEASLMPQVNHIAMDSKAEGKTQFAAINLGGPTDNSATMPVKVENIGVYNFVINYISGDKDRPLKIDVNGVNTGTIYIFPKTTDWNTVATYTIALNLTAKTNSVKFHGDGVNYAPNLGNVIIVPLTVPIPNGVYDLSISGNLTGGASLNSTTNFITNIGGTNKGVVSLSVLLEQSAKYILAAKYLSPDMDRPLGIVINGSNIGVYTLPKTIDGTIQNASVFTLPVNLNKNNTIQFIGDGVNQAPDLSIITLNIMPPPPPAGSISAIGDLQGGATLGSGKLYGYVINLGGVTDASSTVTFTIPNDGLYNVCLNYMNNSMKALPLMIDVNDVKMTVPYLLESNERNIDIIMNLKAGITKFKFHGDGANATPNLNNFMVSPAVLTAPVFDTALGILQNGSVIDTNTGFVKNLGVVSVTIPKLQLKPGKYNLVINYLLGDPSASFKVSVNGENNKLLYNVTKTADLNSSSAMTFTLPISLYEEKKDNVIKFSSNGTKPAPYLGKFKLIAIAPESPAGTIRISSGILENGAIIGSGDLYEFVVNLGGTSDGSATVTINGTKDATYNLTLFYRNIFAATLPLVVDVNGIKFNTYSLPSGFKGRITLALPLKVGANTIKFHGDGVNPVADLSVLSLPPQKR